MTAFGEVLFQRDLQVVVDCPRSFSDENSDRNNIWDDEMLIKSYDKALKIAKEQVAKRIAQSTNNLGPSKENNKPEPSTSKKTKHKNKNTWQTKYAGKKGKLEVGTHCRAPYSEDQNDYEATILRIIDKARCLVRFVGYDNEEEVLISELKPSAGDDARVEQIKVATMLDIKLDIEHNAEDQESLEPMEQSFDESAEKPTVRKINRHFKKRNHMPNIPNPLSFGPTGMPVFNMPPYPSLSIGDLPPLPPPMPFPLAGLGATDDDSQEQQQAMSSMLLSWYMSGYYTGIYQGMMKANASKSKNCYNRKT